MHVGLVLPQVQVGGGVKVAEVALGEVAVDHLLRDLVLAGVFVKLLLGEGHEGAVLARPVDQFRVLVIEVASLGFWFLGGGGAADFLLGW